MFLMVVLKISGLYSESFLWVLVLLAIFFFLTKISQWVEDQLTIITPAYFNSGFVFERFDISHSVDTRSYKYFFANNGETNAKFYEKNSNT